MKSSNLLQKAHPSVNPRCLSYFAWRSNSATTYSATWVGQLGDNLFRLSVCFVLIEQNKLSKTVVLSQGNHAMLHLPHNI